MIKFPIRSLTAASLSIMTTSTLLEHRFKTMAFLSASKANDAVKRQNRSVRHKWKMPKLDLQLNHLLPGQVIWLLIVFFCILRFLQITLCDYSELATQMQVENAKTKLPYPNLQWKFYVRRHHQCPVKGCSQKEEKWFLAAQSPRPKDAKAMFLNVKRCEWTLFSLPVFNEVACNYFFSPAGVAIKQQQQSFNSVDTVWEKSNYRIRNNNSAAAGGQTRAAEKLEVLKQQLAG